MTAWMFITRWGNALLLLPTAACIVVSLWAGGERPLARRWALWFGGAVLLVFATKVAFLGWGLGSRALDFTGISGHSMLAASVLPMFAWWLTQDRPKSTRTAMVVAAVVFAIVVGVSRVLLSTHSVSEMMVGLAVGFTVAWFAIPRGRIAGAYLPLRLVALVALIATGTVSGAGDVDGAHGVIVRVALALSGRAEPFQRGML